MGIEARVEKNSTAGGKAQCINCSRVLQSFEYGIGQEDEQSITDDDRASLVLAAHEHLRTKAGHKVEVVIFKRGA